MIDFYGLTSPNVVKIFIMLEELELPYRFIPVDVWKSENFKPDFLKLNPNAKIPVIVDRDGPGKDPFVVFESGAILLYLADKSGRFLAEDRRERFEQIQWLMIQLTGIGPMFGQWAYFDRYAPPGNEHSLTRYYTEVRRLYDLLEQRLGQTPYIGGSDYSIADISTFPWIRIHQRHGVNWQSHPNLGRWFAAVEGRAGVQRALEKLAAVTSARDVATPEHLDRFFGRGKYARD